MYVDIDKRGEVSLNVMTIEEAIFLQQSLLAISMYGCCDKCKAKARAISDSIREALVEHKLRRSSGVECSMQKSTMS